MEGYSMKDEVHPQLLDLISNEREWLLKTDHGETRHRASEEKKLELRLGPPGDEDLTIKDGPRKDSRTRDESLLSLGYFSKNGSQTHKFSSSSENQCPFIELQPGMAKESSQLCCTKVVRLGNAEKMAFSPASATKHVANSSQKRTAPPPVVGWPPIRSFRKNLASSSSSKPVPDSQNVVPNKVASQKESKTNESFHKGLFVKINMDGVPIGRKVDLKAHDSYEKLSSAVDELFRGLLAAQMDSSTGGTENKQEGEKAITGLLDGSGEYTLVYEDNEGDRMLVGDVPWHMFVSTVKRLRVLKSAELSTLFFGCKQEKIPLDARMK